MTKIEENQIVQAAPNIETFGGRRMLTILSLGHD